MPEAQVTIASAVVVPHSHDSSTTSPTFHKRRDSSPPPTSNEPKRARLNASDNDRGRGRRLFGNVLGNLGKSSVDNKAKKRMEVEAKMQEKLKVQEEAAEIESKEKKGREKLEEKKEWKVQADRVRKTNDQAMANFLVTKTKPPLYYLPWKLLSEQQITIDTQKLESSEGISAKSNPLSPTATRHRSTSQEGRPLAGEGGELNDMDESKDDQVIETKVLINMAENEPSITPEDEQMKVDMGNDEDVVVEY